MRTVTPPRQCRQIKRKSKITINRQQQWRAVRHPVRIYLRGWKLGRRSIISPRGTVFETRFNGNGMIARKRLDYQLNEA